MDIPRYRIKPSPERFLFNKVFALIFLGALVYVGIYVNYYLLNRLIPAFLNWIFIIVIILLLILDLILCYMKYGHYTYTFYDAKISVDDGKIYTFSYSDIRNISYVSNLADKWFRTGSILIELKDDKKLRLRYLKSPNQAYLLIQKGMRSGR